MDQEILDWFGPLNPTTKQTDILSRRQPGTGNWMTEHAVFKDWLEGARNRPLVPWDAYISYFLHYDDLQPNMQTNKQQMVREKLF
jgi:hypothetical protein